MLRISLHDDDLFGNEAAEDERHDVFESYAYERAEVERFCDERRQLQIVRAYKGEGKSALLRLSRMRIVSDSSNSLAIDTSGPALAPACTHSDFAVWVREWKAKVVGLIAGEVGAQIGMAWSDDAMSLVELAEQNGLKQRNIVSAVIDRLRSKHVPVKRERIAPADPSATIRRWASKAPNVWVFVDDIDRNFDGSPQDQLRCAAFFEACRMLIREVPSVRLRIAVRPNTWTTLKRRFEGMSHLEQYASDLKWSEDEVRILLVKRIEGYLRRSRQLSVGEFPPVNLDLLSLAFETPVHWSGRERPVHVPLNTLSLHRPRWLIELCRVASRSAASRRAEQISLRLDVFSQLGAFGTRRLDDTVAEFKPQCPRVRAA